MTLRKKYKRTKKKGKGLDIMNKDPEILKDYVSLYKIFNDENVYLSRLPDDIQQEFKETILLPKKEMKLKEMFKKKILIKHIKELCYNSVFRFFDILSVMKEQLIDFSGHITEQNFVNHKNNVLIPMFNKILQKIEPLRSKNSRQYVIDDSSSTVKVPIYAAPPSVENKEFNKIINLFTSNELVSIYKFFNGYFFGEIPLSYRIEPNDPYYSVSNHDGNGIIRRVDTWISQNYGNTPVAGKTRKKKSKSKKSMRKKLIILS